MRILVTGATGFIGRRIIQRLAGGHEIIEVVRPNGSGTGARNAEVVTLDLAKPVGPSLLPKNVDVLVHLAQANVSFPERANELFAVNTASTQQLLDFARRCGIRRFILASSGDVYGAPARLSRETDHVNPGSFYAATKHAAELFVLACSDYVEPCIVRLFHPFGPGQSRRLVPGLIERIRSAQAIAIKREGRPKVTPIYIDDVVTALERLVTASFRGIVNVAGDEALTVRELAERIGCLLETAPIFVESNESAGDLTGDNSLMKEALGPWSMVSLAEGLARTLKGV